MNKTTAAIIATLMILTGIAIAAGAPSGAETTFGDSVRGEETTSGTADLTGGNITEVNVSGIQNTGRWGGFFGRIEGGLQLGDSTQGLFYEWTVTDYTGAYVYVADDSITDWNLAAGDEANMPSYITEPAADNWSNTFNGTGAFSSASISEITDVPTAQTLDGDGVAAFTTYSLQSGTTPVWAGEAVNEGTGFDNSTVDYQILAPADAGIVSYQFYLELP